MNLWQSSIPGGNPRQSRTHFTFKRNIKGKRDLKHTNKLLIFSNGKNLYNQTHSLSHRRSCYSRQFSEWPTVVNELAPIVKLDGKYCVLLRAEFYLIVKCESYLQFPYNATASMRCFFSKLPTCLHVKL
mmetsp:Transcript_6423/g.15524  ORF Transcript_6423/g.15524 Transcript_6423/m.15524 type:complete len:129 (+) Transcript_6423:452-838(+)